MARLKNLDLHGRLVLYVGFTALLWLIWGLAYALTGYWFPWPLGYMAGAPIVGYFAWRTHRKRPLRQ